MGTRSLHILGALALALGLAAIGCPDDDDDCPPCDECDDDDATAAECDTDDGCADWEICEVGACVDGDRNEGFDDAPLLALDGSERGGWINPAGDVDYFRIAGDRGMFFSALAQTDDPTGDGGLDTVLRLWSADGSELGYNDTFVRLEHLYGSDAYYLGCTPRDASYYLTVEDHGSFANDPDAMVAGPDATYTLRVDEFDPGAVEDEPNDTPDDATDAALAEYNINYDRGGVIDADGDVDLWRVDLAAGDRLRIYAVEHAATELSSRVRVLDADGVAEVARFDDLGWTLEAGVPALTDGPLYLEIGDRGGEGGDGYCYVIHLAADPAGEVYHAETEPNDDDLGAEPLQESENGWLAAAGRIGAPGDVDHFVLQGPAGGGELSVTLQARDYGSSLAAHVAVIDPDGVTLLDADVGGDGALLDAEAVTAAGTYHVVVTAADPAAGGVDQWYGVFAKLE